MGRISKSLLRSVIFGYATGRPTGYNSFGSFTVEWTFLTSFSSIVNLRQLTVTKRVLNFHDKRPFFLKRAKSTNCNVQNNAVFVTVMHCEKSTSQFLVNFNLFLF